MAGSTFGTILRVTTFGESHGTALGAVLDGCPSGIPISEETIQQYLNLRKPGQTKYSTPRKESDSIRLMSGVFEGKTTGTPILLLAQNESQRSIDYSEIASYYRPGHADYTFDEKYGFRDYRGGGRSSGRETLGRVAAGAIAIEFLKLLGIEICAYTKSIGTVFCTENTYETLLNCSSALFFDRIAPEQLSILREKKLASPLYMPDVSASARAEDELAQAMADGDSLGGMIECVISGMPTGIGEPVFDKLDARLAQAVLSIGAVKGFELGSGFAAASARGSENNDSFVTANFSIRSSDGVATAASSIPDSITTDNADFPVRKCTNHAGGILGGISDGSDIVFRAAIKPTPSISSEQNTVNKSGETIKVRIKGRHDPVIVPRAVVVVETMAALTIADALLVNMGARADRIAEFYCKKKR